MSKPDLQEAQAHLQAVKELVQRSIKKDKLTNGGRIRCHALLRQLEGAEQTLKDAIHVTVE